MTLRPLYTLNQQHNYKEPSLNTDGADRRVPCVMGRNATRDRLQQGVPRPCHSCVPKHEIPVTDFNTERFTGQQSSSISFFPLFLSFSPTPSLSFINSLPSYPILNLHRQQASTVLHKKGTGQRLHWQPLARSGKFISGLFLLKGRGLRKSSVRPIPDFIRSTLPEALPGDRLFRYHCRRAVSPIPHHTDYFLITFMICKSLDR